MLRIGLVLGLLSLVGCDRGAAPEGDAPAGDEALAGEAAPAASAPAALPCALSRVAPQIESMRLEGDGGCQVFLPANATPGSYEVRVSAAGDAAAAAVELRTGETTLYATGGTVTLTAAGADGWVGRVDAVDQAEPGTGRIRGEFTIAATP
jgi:hypothetical protein